MASGEDELRNCVVCGDRATGYHFHALTCEGCKGFFRRTVSKSTGPTCLFAGSCEVSKAQRRHCPACRLQKCLDAGMRKDTLSYLLLGTVILSAEALALRRAKQAQRRAEQETVQLSKEQEELIQTLLGAHTRHMGSIAEHFVHFRPPAYLFIPHQPSPTLVPVLPLLRHFADINTFMVQQVIKFTKDLPLFRSLPMEDQISLLKGAAVEICHISINPTFCIQTQNFLCGPLRYTMEDGAHDRPGVTQREEIDQLQEEMALTLQSYIKGQQPKPRNRFLYAKLLGLLAELRSVNNAFGYQIQRIQGLPAMMPLLQEICS
ncbi:nuclear receptor subfamily 1 group I member 3 isoform X9 [Otolemur garnettii]|uniref:nuclear receptor subfamily 1 group I member 3 isoform X9 n=1 Tax=Otolemur garnettii TaxID=30611 RepID=UPI000644573C|nr:nuclear receptor subfamily 1 group I member 3 isoform X9 [Otolemur garnettii]